MAYHCHSLLRDVLQRCWSCCRTSSSSAVRCLSIPLGPLPLLLSLRRGTGTLCCRGRRTGRPGCGSFTLVSAPWAGEDAAAVPQRCGAAAPPGGWLLMHSGGISAYFSCSCACNPASVRVRRTGSCTVRYSSEAQPAQLAGLFPPRIRSVHVKLSQFLGTMHCVRSSVPDPYTCV
eukprot:COSAG01_NODE_3194_length_6432_cov_70.852361_4_plen_175_part_00